MSLTMDNTLIEFDYAEIKLCSVNNSTQISEIGSYNDVGYQEKFKFIVDGRQKIEDSIFFSIGVYAHFE